MLNCFTRLLNFAAGTNRSQDFEPKSRSSALYHHSKRPQEQTNALGGNFEIASADKRRIHLVPLSYPALEGAGTVIRIMIRIVNVHAAAAGRPGSDFLEFDDQAKGACPGRTERPANRARSPRDSSMRNASFHLAIRSEREKDPTFN
jgi:hypothetical protein